jgi:hypothetical protein
MALSAAIPARRADLHRRDRWDHPERASAFSKQVK